MKAKGTSLEESFFEIFSEEPRFSDLPGFFGGVFYGFSRIFYGLLLDQFFFPIGIYLSNRSQVRPGVKKAR